MVLGVLLESMESFWKKRMVSRTSSVLWYVELSWPPSKGSHSLMGVNVLAVEKSRDGVYATGTSLNTSCAPSGNQKCNGNDSGSVDDDDNHSRRPI